MSHFILINLSLQTDSSPNKFSEFISLMISNFENSSFIELRTGFNSQKHGNLVRLLDKDSNWSYDNGFKTMIPSCLTYSILGYPFILPDMIGGNAYNGKPDRELYLRWLALNSLLPVSCTFEKILNKFKYLIFIFIN